MVWYGMEWRGMVWYGTVWRGMVWRGTVLDFDFTLFFQKGEFSVTGFTATWRKDLTYIAEDRE